MSAVLEAVRPITLTEIREARARIAGTVLRTPLVRLELGPGFPDVRLKLENLQPINAYKLRGAVNAVAMLSAAERKRGVWTISAGNAGQGVAYAARNAGVPCTVVAIETAPVSKIERHALHREGRSRLARHGARPRHGDEHQQNEAMGDTNHASSRYPCCRAITRSPDPHLPIR